MPLHWNALRRVPAASVLLCTLAACRAESHPPATVRDEPRMRPAPQGGSSAVYFTLRNPSADTLVLTGVEIDVADTASIHQSMNHNDMASMMPVTVVAVPPRDSVVFAERGLHIMAQNLRAALVIGDTVVVRLRLAPARVDTLRVPVRE
jgi:periplasmic copper chaperone A